MKKTLRKITVFDKIVILLLLLGVLFFGYYFFRKPEYKEVVIKVNEETIRYEPWNQNIFQPIGTRTWVAQLFSPGLTEKDGLGKVTAEIKDVYTYDIAPARKSVYLITNLNSTYSRANNQYTYKGKPLIVGSIVKINFSGVYVEGMIVDVDGLPNPRVNQKLNVSARLTEETGTYLESSGARPYLVDALAKQKEIFDGNGNIIAKIHNIRSEDAKRLVTTSDGRTVVSTNPLRKDIYLELEVNAFKLDGKYFMFDDVPLLIGENIPLNTTYYSIYPEITDITSVE